VRANVGRKNMKTARVILAVAFVIVAATCASMLWRSHRYEQGICQLTEGMTRDDVKRILGKPRDVIPGDSAMFTDPSLTNCSEEYWYDDRIRQTQYAISFKTDGTILKVQQYAQPPSGADVSPAAGDPSAHP
jgi:outer membrane protein assembly factor BamE (lipoprotein component of BamABCDE complex)